MTTTPNKQRPRATGEQLFLDNITRNVEIVIEQLKDNLNYLVNISKSKNLNHQLIKIDIDRSIKQIQFAINNLKDVPEMAYIRWSQLYQENAYW